MTTDIVERMAKISVPKIHTEWDNKGVWRKSITKCIVQKLRML